MSHSVIDDVRRAADGNWTEILQRLAIPVNRKEGPCPCCGGKTRYRFDDKEGRGTYFCSHCGSGTGLDLVMKANQTDVRSAALLVADVLGMNVQGMRSPTSQGAGQQQKELAERRAALAQQQAEEQAARAARFMARLTALTAQAQAGEPAYLAGKGLPGFTFPVLPDGALLLSLVDESGAVVAAQTITAQGEKRLLSGSAKKGAYHAINAPESLQEVIIGEGLATVLSVHLMRPDALAVVAIDAGNLLPVAQVMRQQHPQAKIVIAADNDIAPGEPNTGKDAAEKAAAAVTGWVALPPTDHKADWNDYHQQHGADGARAAFTDSLNQPGRDGVKPQLQAIEGGKSQHKVSAGDISQMAASQKAKLLSGRWDQLAVNPDSGAVYCYGAGVWRKLADSELERVMVSIFEEYEAHYTDKGIKSVVATMKLQLPVLGEQRGDLIGFDNGVYDLTAQTFSPHSPDNWLMNHNGISYTPAVPGEDITTHAPNFSRWLNHATGGNTQKGERIKAALFMVLAKRHDWQLFIEVTGEGGSGKSVFSSIATTLAGEHNTASGSMSTLDMARGRAQFVGKSLIIMPDQTRYVGEGAGIKAITGGDPVEIDGKYEKQFTTVLNAVVMATNNEPMTFTERNGGIARRRVIFPFNNPVSEAVKDPDLTAKIRREIPVIIRHLLLTFASQNKARELLIEQRDSQEALDVKRGTDPVIDMCAALYFMNEPRGLMMGGGTWAGQPEPRAYLYHLYLAFLEYHGLGKPLSVEKFSRAMKNSAKEYRTQYLTRKVKGRTQTNLSITELAEEFLPRAYGVEIPDNAQ
ncbi:TPA: toprim domain-containing protein [Citrobacter werkmanii]